MSRIDVSAHRSPATQEVCVVASFNKYLLKQLEPAIIDHIGRVIADKYMEDHYVEIASRLDQNAIVNLAVAECSKKIAEEIRATPTVIYTDGKRRGW